MFWKLLRDAKSSKNRQLNVINVQINISLGSGSRHWPVTARGADTLPWIQTQNRDLLSLFKALSFFGLVTELLRPSKRKERKKMPHRLMILRFQQQLPAVFVSLDIFNTWWYEFKQMERPETHILWSIDNGIFASNELFLLCSLSRPGKQFQDAKLANEVVKIWLASKHNFSCWGCLLIFGELPIR